MTEPRDPEQVHVPVSGGNLSVLHWPADSPAAPLVVLVHGITANGMAWARVAGALAGPCEVLAPDLRGRAGSAELPGPYGLAAHAADVAAVIGAFLGSAPSQPPARRPVVLVGHSMGAFVVALAAAQSGRDGVQGVVLIDGGLSLPQPPGADIDAMLAAVLGPSLDRLTMTFPDLSAVRTFWAAHPAVGPWVDVPSVAAFLTRDLVPADGGLRSACVREAVRVDGADVLVNEALLAAVADLPVPATLLWAPRGLQDQVPGLYDPTRLADLGAQRLGITGQEVPDTNHYSIIWAPHGVDAVADTVRRAAGVG
jgi:pimeloyl-ACP methyl ester carboxylesterase